MINFINGHKFVTLLFDEDINRFVDGMGNVVHDIFRIITPNQFMLFKKYKEMVVLSDVTNTYGVTLVYLEESKDLKY
jgi:hypothetical protein